MVKLTGPGLATKASGSLGEELIFSTWKGKAYVKQHRKPTQPRTGKQIGMRVTMAALSSAWKLATAPQHATWNELAAASNISAFNAHTAYNLSRWRDNNTPTRSWPATPTTVTRTWTSPTLAVQGRTITIAWNLTALGNGWFVPIYRVNDQIEKGDWDQLIGMIYQVAPGPNHFIDHAPIVGRNFYSISLCSTDGYEIPSPWHKYIDFP